MKRIKFFSLFNVIIYFSFTLIFSCIDEVKLNLKPATDVLVVDASINWFKGTDGKQQRILLSKSANFYNTEVPKISGAKITISNENNEVFIFKDQGKGIYLCENFKPEINQKYTLKIEYNNELYSAESTLYKTPKIKNIIQKNDGGLLGDELEIRAYFQDSISSKDYYMLRFRDKSKNQPDYQIISDELFNGNLMFGIYTSGTKIEDKPIKGDTLNVNLYKIDKQNYDFLNILFKQIGGNPFSSVSSNAKGNILNITNPNNIVYGYFRLSEVDSKNYIIK